MKVPTTRYARSGDVRIAYQVIGNGPIDLVLVPGFMSNLELHWEDPGYSHLLRRLSAFARVIQFDKRGTGLSDRVDLRDLPNLETRMDDVRAVMDAAGSGRAVLLGASEGGPMSILFAATYPERTRALVLYGAYAHFHTWVMGQAALDQFIANIESTWGTGASASAFAPEQSRDERFRDWWGRYERMSMSPSAAVALARMNALIDVRSVLPAITVPTLVVHRSEDARVKSSGGKYLAAAINGSRHVEIPGRDHPVWTGDVDRVVDEIEEFLTGTRPQPDQDRVLAALMVARVAPAPRIDRLSGEKLARLQQIAADIVARHRGHIFSTAGQDVRAAFDGPARAVRCAMAVKDAAQGFGLAVNAGVHVGEVTMRDDVIAGPALDAAEAICALADRGEILVSSTLTGLVEGSGLHFEERRVARIDGFEHPLQLHGVIAEQHLEPAVREAKAPRLDVLSSREREVLTLVASGMSNAAIAKELSLSDHTVKRHVANILLKLDLPTRAAAAALAARQASPGR